MRNLVLLCKGCHAKAGAHEAKVRHVKMLRERYGYDYEDMGDLWQQLAREAE